MDKKGKMVFFMNALRNPITGSIVPSQKFLINKLVSPIGERESKLIVELGTGSGCVTKKILERRKRNCRVLSFEINRELASMTAQKIKADKFRIINDDAANLLKYMPKESADFIISSLPLGNLKKEKVMSILSAVKDCLKEGGVYMQYQYLLADFSKIRRVFPRVKIGYALLNFPPAFVYRCVK